MSFCFYNYLESLGLCSGKHEVTKSLTKPNEEWQDSILILSVRYNIKIMVVYCQKNKNKIK